MRAENQGTEIPGIGKKLFQSRRTRGKFFARDKQLPTLTLLPTPTPDFQLLQTSAPARALEFFGTFDFVTAGARRKYL